MKVSIIIPVYKGAGFLSVLLSKLSEQNYKDYELIVIDSSSPDDSALIAASFNARVITIKKQDFDHGGTRSLGGKESQGDVIIYLTQDVIPFDNNSIGNILKPFNAELKDTTPTGAVYGRQIAHLNATPFAAHSRHFIYPENSYTRVLADKDRFMIKTAFLSNSFSAYSRKAMNEIGWFKSNLITTEDTYAGAKMLAAGYKIIYAADAVVYHSHNYSIKDEFQRYFDIGSFHRNEDWIFRDFGNADDEGFRFVLSEFKFLIKIKKYLYLPEFFIRNLLKFIGHRLGYHYKILPKWLILRLGKQKNWWSKNLKKLT